MKGGRRDEVEGVDIDVRVDFGRFEEFLNASVWRRRRDCLRDCLGDCLGSALKFNAFARLTTFECLNRLPRDIDKALQSILND